MSLDIIGNLTKFNAPLTGNGAAWEYDCTAGHCTTPQGEVARRWLHHGQPY